MLNMQTPGNRATGRNLRTRPVQGNLCGSDSKDRVSEHEDHKPSRHDEGFPIFAKEVGMKVAIHLGQKNLANLQIDKNTNFHEIQILFNITQKLILGHSEEILNVHSIESTPSSWARSVLSHDQAIKWDEVKSMCSMLIPFCVLDR